MTQLEKETIALARQVAKECQQIADRLKRVARKSRLRQMKKPKSGK